MFPGGDRGTRRKHGHSGRVHAPDRERNRRTVSKAACGENHSSKYLLGTRLDLFRNDGIDGTQCTTILFLVASYPHSSSSSPYPCPLLAVVVVAVSPPKDVDLQYTVQSPAQAQIRESTVTVGDSTSGTSGRGHDVVLIFTYLATCTPLSNAGTDVSVLRTLYVPLSASNMLSYDLPACSCLSTRPSSCNTTRDG